MTIEALPELAPLRPPLAVTEPVPAPELQVLRFQAPDTEPETFHTLAVLKRPVELISEPENSKVSVLGLVDLTRPKVLVEPKHAVVTEPKLVRKSVIKPAHKISSASIVKAKVELSFKNTVARGPEYKEKIQSIRLKERGAKLTTLAIGAVALSRSGIVKAPKLIKINKEKVTGKVKTFKTNIAERNVTTNLQDTVKNAPLKAVIAVKNRFYELNNSRLNESLAERKKYLFLAIGVVAFTGLAYLKFKGYQGHDEMTDAATSGVNPASGSENVVSDTYVGSGKPIQNWQITEQVTDLTDLTPAAGESIDVSQGDGIGNLIEDRAAGEGLNLSGSKIYDMYQQLDVKLDGNLITGDTYRMPNGDLGISSPGHFAWQQEAQRMLDEMIEAEKKKKS